MILPLLLAGAATAAHGPDTCKTGYVWREATSGDHVCVAPEVRKQVLRDNAEAKSRFREMVGGARRLIVGVSSAFGPDTCLTGYVWREATADDHVCVLPEVRAQAKRDNAAAASRYVNE